MFAHRVFEHRVDDQVEAHARAVSGYGSLAQRDDGELIAHQLHHRLLALQLRNAVRVIGAGRTALIVEVVFGISVDGAGGSVNKPSYLRELGDICEIRGCCRVEDEILVRRVLRHRIVGQASKEDDLIVGSQIIDGQLKNVFIKDAHLAWQVIAKPEEVDDIDLVATVQQFRDQSRAHISSSASNKKFHNFS